MAKWSPHKFHEALTRETNRLAGNENMTEIERETLVELLDEVVHVVMAAEPPNVGHKERVNDEFVQALRDAIRERKKLRYKDARLPAHYPFDLLTAEEIRRGAGGANVEVVDFRPPKDSR